MAKHKKSEETEEAPQSNSEKLNSALQIFDEMDKSYAGFKSKRTVIECIDSGSPLVNEAITVNGIPRGRIVQIYGPQGSGKSFMAQIWAREVVKNDPNAFCAWFDAEHSFNYEWAKKLGIWDEDPKKSRIKVFKGAKGVDIIERIVGKIKKDGFGAAKKVQNGILDFVKEGKLNCPLIVIDSLGAIISPREEDAPVGGFTVGALAGFLTAELKRLSGILEDANVCLVCINQVRQSLDAGKYGESFHFPGGESLKHQMSLNIYVEKSNKMEDLILEETKNRNTLIGQKVKVVIKKNRFGPVPRSCETTLLFKEGAGYDQIGIINVENEIIELAIARGLILQGGAWYTIGAEKIHSEKKVQEYLKSNPLVMKDLVSKIKETKSINNEVDEIFDDTENILETNNPEEKEEE